MLVDIEGGRFFSKVPDFLIMALFRQNLLLRFVTIIGPKHRPTTIMLFVALVACALACLLVVFCARASSAPQTRPLICAVPSRRFLPLAFAGSAELNIGNVRSGASFDNLKASWGKVRATTAQGPLIVRARCRARRT